MIFEEEQLIDAILLEPAELDEEANGPSKRSFNDYVLLPSNLSPCQCEALVKVGQSDQPLPGAAASVAAPCR